MAVLVIIESVDNQITKRAKEAVGYARQVAALLESECIALTFGNPEDAGALGQFGANRVVNIGQGEIPFSSTVYSDLIVKAAESLQANIIVLNHSTMGKTLAGGLSILLNAGLASSVVSVPAQTAPFTVDRMVFSGKAIGKVEIKSPNKIITIQNNSFPASVVGDSCSVDQLSIDVPEMPYEVVEIKKQDGLTPLPEAELVVSGGRGFKGPENWGILLELAEALGATTACSRPVADSHWRPHHEHVGQTGVAIRPNLYIAIGISGAIQHLGGVNNSKTIVVINKDPEAPFFKAADYGVVGDLFEVVPRLTEAVKQYKGQGN